jgi:osmoprotectant transport system substrate-binding protein
LKKGFATLAAVVMILGLLAACGDSTAGGASSNGTAANGGSASGPASSGGASGSGAAGSEPAAIINPGDPIIVSTMNDTEGEILGKMMVLALRDAGYEVTDNVFGYSGTVNGRTALLEKETDIYMDYTGRGLRLIEGVDESLYHNMETAWQSVSEWDKANNNLIWTRYAPFNNTDAIAVRKEFAEENNVYDMYDFARYVNEGGYVNLVVHPYWVTLSTGLPGMEATYGFKLSEDQYTISGGNDEQLLAEGTGGVNVCMLYSSSGLAYHYGFVILDDPQVVSPVYSPCPIIVAERLERYPGVADALNNVFESIALAEMVEMNARVEVNGESGEAVAREYLLGKNLIKSA